MFTTSTLIYVRTLEKLYYKQIDHSKIVAFSMLQHYNFPRKLFLLMKKRGFHLILLSQVISYPQQFLPFFL